MHPLIIFSSLLLAFTVIVFNFIHTTLWRPYRIQRHFLKQGIRGPGYRPIYGNAPEVKQGFDDIYNKPMPSFSHDVGHRIDPCCHKWRAMYGKTMLFWHGSTPRLALAEPKMLSEVFMKKSVAKMLNPPAVARMVFGKGLINLHGDEWSLHRKIATPAFTLDMVKSWIPEVVKSVEMRLKKWESEDEVEVDVLKESDFLVADILSRTAFGSNFEEGKRIFQIQDQLALLVLDALRTIHIPGLRFLPTSSNRKRWEMRKEVRNRIRTIIDSYAKRGENHATNSLLGFLLKGGLSPEDIIHECQAFYFAGKEAMAKFVCWTLVILAFHQDWQFKAREEVLQVCNKNTQFPNGDTTNDLKIVTMILNESLRLYPPISLLVREATQDMKVGNVNVPRGTHFYLPVALVHHDTQIWGADANEFNPLRFSEPRKHPTGAFLPFASGSRMCVAQNFSMVECKIIISMILKQFSFRLSPSYVHSPVTFLTITPELGAQLLFKKL